MIEYLKSFFRRRKYYFVSYSDSKGFGSANVSTINTVSRKVLERQIAKGTNVTGVVILYYKRISKRSSLDGTL